MLKLRPVLVASMCLLMTSAAGAAPLFGGFSIAGNGDVRVGTDFIDWGEVGNIFGPTDGDIDFVSGTGSFAVLETTTGKIADLNATDHPVGVPFSLSGFLKSDAMPGWEFTLDFIHAGVGDASGCTSNVGDLCTPFPNSPFTILNTAGGGSTVSMSVAGTVSDGVGPVSILKGTFTTQFSDLTAEEILALLQSQDFVQSSHSAEFSAEITPIPEPASMILLGTGLLGTGYLRRRWQKRSV